MPITDEDRQIMETAMRLAADQGWRALTLAEIARDSGIPLARVYERMPSKMALLTKIMRLADQAVLEVGVVEPVPAETDRDRLFDVLMRRFDALRPYRDGLRAVYRDLRYRPLSGGLLGLSLNWSMGWMRVAAGLEGKGPPACIANGGLAVVYLNAFRVWLEDDTADMARTMAALDRGLRRGEELAGMCGHRSRSSRSAEPPAETAETQAS